MTNILQEVLDKSLILLSYAIPLSIIRFTETSLVEANINIPVRKYLGLSILTSYTGFVVVFIVLRNFLGSTEYLIVSIFSLIIVEGSFLFVPNVLADNRGKQIEDVLPDALIMISANMRAGMALENAVIKAARPEFGPLEEEIKIVSTKAYSGISVMRALTEMGERVRSNSLKRIVRLLAEGSALGGQMAQLLYDTAVDMRNTVRLKREIVNATIMYTIFIIFSSVIASPILFASSVFYINMSEKITQDLDLENKVPAEALGPVPLPIGKSGDKLSGAEMNMFALASLTTTTFFASLVLAQIRHGRAMAGLKYVPIFVGIALSLYFLATFGLNELFKSILRV